MHIFSGVVAGVQGKMPPTVNFRLSKIQNLDLEIPHLADATISHTSPIRETWQSLERNLSLSFHKVV